jgi:hypothetical protein
MKKQKDYPVTVTTSDVFPAIISPAVIFKTVIFLAITDVIIVTGLTGVAAKKTMARITATTIRYSS